MGAYTIKGETRGIYAFFLEIHECDEGWDYTLYDKDYKVIDGGVLDDPDMDLEDAMMEIASMYEFIQAQFDEIDYDEFSSHID